MSGTYYPSNPAYGMPPPMGMPPAELQSLKSMLGVARILTLVIAIITLLIVIGVGVALLFAPILVVSLGFTIVALIIDWIIWFQIGEIIQMVDRGQYDAAKNKTIIWMILGFIFGWIIVGIFLLLAYLKFDPVINWQRQMGQGAMPPGQPFGYGTAPMGGSPMMGSAPAGGPPMATPPAASAPASSAPSYGAPAQPFAAAPAASPAYAAAPAAAPVYAAPAAAAPVAAASGTGCPRCGRPATWIAQYNRWYCYSCQQYV